MGFTRFHVRIAKLAIGMRADLTPGQVNGVRSCERLRAQETHWPNGGYCLAVHFHCCVIDGVFTAGEDGQVRFAEAGVLTPEDLAAVQQQVRARVLRWFALLSLALIRDSPAVLSRSVSPPSVLRR